MLVHGAFADASSWTGVVERLQARGIQVTAPANPLRGIAADSAYLTSLLDQIPGPVLVVGHSYGGAVISNAAARAKNVVGLVFVAAFAPEEGETLEGRGGSGPAGDRAVQRGGAGAVPVGTGSVWPSAIGPNRYEPVQSGSARMIASPVRTGSYRYEPVTPIQPLAGL